MHNETEAVLIHYKESVLVLMLKIIFSKKFQLVVSFIYYYSLYLPSITASSKKYTNSNRQRNTFIS